MVINCDEQNGGGLWHGEVSINVTLDFITLLLTYVLALPSLIHQQVSVIIKYH